MYKKICPARARDPTGCWRGVLIGPPQAGGEHARPQTHKGCHANKHCFPNHTPLGKECVILRNRFTVHNVVPQPTVSWPKKVTASTQLLVQHSGDGTAGTAAAAAVNAGTTAAAAATTGDTDAAAAAEGWMMLMMMMKLLLMMMIMMMMPMMIIMMMMMVMMTMM